MSIVYRTTNLINGKKYIGVDTKNNPEYLGSGVLLKKAIEKYGVVNFKKETIKRCQSPELAFEYERELIKKLDAQKDPDYYNLHEGGSGGKTWIGDKRPQRHRDNISAGIGDRSGEKNSNWNNRWSHEQKDAMSSRRLGTIYVNRDGVDKFIQLAELESYLSDGWTKGRSALVGSISIFKGNDQKLINQAELDSYLSNGWQKGRTEEYRNNISKGQLGKNIWTKNRKWINNGLKELRVYEHEISKYLESGWELGRSTVIKK